jgi:hypothetical protein
MFVGINEVKEGQPNSIGVQKVQGIKKKKKKKIAV